MKKILLTLTMILLLVIACGCGGDETSSSNDAATFAMITDDIGRHVTLDHKPERIVVTSASFLEPLRAVGGSVVGRPDSKTQMPDWAKDIASVGQVYQIDVERLIACNPDLVIINKGMNEKLVSVLDENHIASLVIDMKTYDDVKSELRTFAILTDNMSKADEIIESMDTAIKSTVDSVPHENHHVAILHSTAQGLSVQLEGSIAGNIIKMFGWTNVADGMTPLESNPDAAPYSIETLAQQNPEIIFVTSMGKLDEIKSNMRALIDENPAWQSIGAIQNDQLYYLPQDLFLLSPGLRYPDAVKMVADLIYPSSKE